MATNADPVVTDDKKVTEEDLRNDKLTLEVETAKAEDETKVTETSTESEEASEEIGQTEDQAEGEAEAEPTFVKQVPSISGDTEEEYLKNLEIAYQASTTEALRLKALTEEAKSEDDSEESVPVDPRLLYLDRLLNKDIETNFAEFKKDYPQVDDPVEYQKFTAEAKTLSEYYQSKRQMLTADELYPKVAKLLGWEKESTPDGKDKLGMALKDNGATSKTTSSTNGVKPKSKVTDEMIRVNKLMYPDKTEAEIREELEPYVK